MNRPKILLIQPPVYDFTAYDFWLRPYGMIRAAGRIAHACDLSGFDFLVSLPRDAWGRGGFPETTIARPAVFGDIPRKFRRFGRPREEFREFLRGRQFDAALIQTSMTWWYPGLREVIEDLRTSQPCMRIVLGGVYATLCPAHAGSLEVDLVLEGTNLAPLTSLLGVEEKDGLPSWDSFVRGTGVLKLTDGCPFRCTYCMVPLKQPEFRRRPLANCLEELRTLVRLGAHNVAFYDDALLFEAESGLAPFLQSVLQEGIGVNFHTPNALNARFMTAEIAGLMVRAGFRTFYLGLESADHAWQQKTGGKVRPEEFSAAVAALRNAGAESIIAYIILGHPDTDSQEVENTAAFAKRHGARVMLAEFAPVPGTPDGERARQYVDMDEPLNHNKTAFTIRRLGLERFRRLKSLGIGSGGSFKVNHSKG